MVTLMGPRRLGLGNNNFLQVPLPTPGLYDPDTKNYGYGMSRQGERAMKLPPFTNSSDLRGVSGVTLWPRDLAGASPSLLGEVGDCGCTGGSGLVGLLILGAVGGLGYWLGSRAGR